MEDLRWLGLNWPTPVLHQSTRAPAHTEALRALQARGLIYPCTCTRAEIQAAAGAPQEGAEMAAAYPGICRHRAHVEPGKPFAFRLDMRKAIAALGGEAAVRALQFQELGHGPKGEQGAIPLDPYFLVDEVGDIVLQRKDGAFAYHFAVVLDDAWQGVTHVTRGNDLFTSTPVHRVLQALMGLPTPLYRHHALLRDSSGRRLAKRDGDMALSALRYQGLRRQDIQRMIQETLSA